MIRTALIALLTAWMAGAADAASFDCGKAQSTAERAICANPGLSRQDEAMAAGYRASAGQFGGDGTALTRDLVQSQRSWLLERDACPDLDCLHKEYAERIALLEFRPRPGRNSDADRWAGRYGHGGFIELVIQVRDDTSVRVAIAGADPAAARWTCSFGGIGTPTDAGLIVGTPAALTVRRRAAGVTVSEGAPNDATSEASCGLNGSLIWDYDRMDP